MVLPLAGAAAGLGARILGSRAAGAAVNAVMNPAAAAGRAATGIAGSRAAGMAANAGIAAAGAPGAIAGAARSAKDAIAANPIKSAIGGAAALGAGAAGAAMAGGPNVTAQPLDDGGVQLTGDATMLEAMLGAPGGPELAQVLSDNGLFQMDESGGFSVMVPGEMTRVLLPKLAEVGVQIPE